MPTLQERTVIDLGQGSLIITLPKPWLRFYGIKAGDKVMVTANGELTVKPKRKSHRRGGCHAD